MVFDPKAFAYAELQALLRSKTFKAVVGMEALAVMAFVNGVVDGTQHLGLHDLQGWLAFQAAAIVVLLMRHTWAGVEVKLDGMVDPKVLQKAEDAFQDRALAALRDKHPEAAATLQAAFKNPAITEGK